MATIIETNNPTRLNAEELFDSVGAPYEKAFESCTPQQDSINWLLSQLPPSATVLDIGCGTGRPVCSSLADAGHNVHGIDVSGVMISAARQNVPKGARFEKIDIKHFTPPPSTKYDAITVYFSLIASVTQDEIRNIFNKVYSWLKPGGVFIFATVPISANNAEISWLGRPITVSSLSQEEAVDAIRGSGFDIVQVHTSKFMPRAAQVGICEERDVWEEDHLFVYARKGKS